MHGEGGAGCDFCTPGAFGDAEVLIRHELCMFAARGFGDDLVVPGAGLIVPTAHRESPFELTAEEWAATRVLLLEAKAAIDQRLRPDGYNLVWNVAPDAGQEVAHVHLHVIPRFHDEPLAGRGARWWLKKPENLRPHPATVGHIRRRFADDAAFFNFPS
jgi:diadenosine tetraphosphate (Ap4A) HIT family hydrolase